MVCYWKREKDLKRFEVPYSRDQVKKIQAAGLANVRAKTAEGSSAFFYVNIALVSIIVVLAAYKFWPRESVAA